MSLFYYDDFFGDPPPISADDAQSAEQSPFLELRLRVFELRVGIADDPGAGVEMGAASVQDAGAQRHRELAVARLVEPAHRCRVPAALVVLVLGDVAVTGGGTAKQIVGALMIQGTLSGTTSMNGQIKLLYSSAMISKLNALSSYEISSWIDQ